MRPGSAAKRHQVRAKLVVDACVLPFAEEIDVVVGQHPPVSVRIVQLSDSATAVLYLEAIVGNGR